MKSNKRAKTEANVFGDYLGTLSLGEPLSYENMTVFPVFTASPQHNGYMLLDEAVRSGRFTVTEVTEGGSVPNLKVVNDLDSDVLILDGDILVGAKQNRSVTTTIIIAKKTTSVINVNCVEHGRWSYKGRSFEAGELPVYSKLRAAKAKSVTMNLKGSRGFVADQGAVWNDISMKAASFSKNDAAFKPSSTGAADELYSSYEERIRGYEEAFGLKPDQVGFVVLISGKVAGCDIFGNPGVFLRVYSKGIKSYILDAIEQAFMNKKSAEAEEPKREASSFLAGIGKLKIEAFPSTGKGINVRFEGQASNGFAALDGDQVVHVAAFRS
ncbi:MAG TPA: DUF6569 family protein [Nitrospirota bacterium]|nr:DUF6569 family protein [Nitrospirota bacterium]